MADSVMTSVEEILLYDKFPGAPIQIYDEPTDGFLGSDHQDVASAKYPLGTKVQVYSDGTVGPIGWSTMVYAQLGTQDAVALAIKSLCSLETATWDYKLTNDSQVGTVSMTSVGCYAISAMTNSRYGWFWCGGVAPEAAIPTFTGTLATDGSVLANIEVIGAANAATTYMVLGELLAATVNNGFGLALAIDDGD